MDVSFSIYKYEWMDEWVVGSLSYDCINWTALNSYLFTSFSIENCYYNTSHFP